MESFAMVSVNHSRSARSKLQQRSGRAAPATEACEQPVDLDHLARQTLGDAALEREVLGLFLSQGEIFIARLRSARTAESWRLAAHTIKGSARNIGAWQLAETARAAEELTPADRRSKVMADQVAEALDRTNRFIETRLPAA
jgi:HPt (histidine-containing phosphotransfer) domain-containing protein